MASEVSIVVCSNVVSCVLGGVCVVMFCPWDVRGIFCVLKSFVGIEVEVGAVFIDSVVKVSVTRSVVLSKDEVVGSAVDCSGVVGAAAKRQTDKPCYGSRTTGSGRDTIYTNQTGYTAITTILDSATC